LISFSVRSDWIDWGIAMEHGWDKRRIKLMELLGHLKAGRDVQTRSLRTWLGLGEFARYEAAWQEQKELRNELAAKPDLVEQYEKRFRHARFLESRANGYAAQGNMQQAHKFRAESEKAYERLIEHYVEAISADMSLHEWFDRHLDLSAVSAPSLVAGCMPQVVTSRSAHKATGHHLTEQKKTKKAVKIEAVEAALASYDDKFAQSLNESKHSAFVQKLLTARAES